MAMSQDEIFQKVSEVLQEALGVDEDEVTPEAKLSSDLGAESIDYLDIAFRLEKAFGIKIDQAEMTQEEVLTNPEYVQDGKVTDKGMEELKSRLPEADWSEFDQSRAVSDFMDVFTVDLICKFVQRKLESAES